MIKSVFNPFKIKQLQLGAWHRVVVWAKLAEIVNEYLKKGRQVYVEGQLQTRQWEDKEGQTRYTTEIRANEVVMLGGRGSGAEGGAPAETEYAPVGGTPRRDHTRTTPLAGYRPT